MQNVLGLLLADFLKIVRSKYQARKVFQNSRKTQGQLNIRTSGWKLSDAGASPERSSERIEDSCRKYITFTDKTGIGTVKLVGSRDIHFVSKKDIKRVRIVKRADGYYCQFCIKSQRLEDFTPTGNSIGIDVGLESFYTDSNGAKVANPRHLRRAEKRLKRLQKLVSRKKKGSFNRRKAINKLGRQHLTVSRRRKDFVVKTARALCTSNDVIVLENLNVRGLIKNHNLAKSIADVSWSLFRQWLEYFGKVFNRQVIAVNPAYTSQDCFSCGKRVKKSLSTRTHKCNCGASLCRDENAAINILRKGIVGHTITTPVYGVNASGQMTLWSDLETSTIKVAG